jgi:hypothetical protein
MTGAADLASRACDWLLATARPGESGLTWGGDEFAASLYSGTAGVVLGLLEAATSLGRDDCADAAVRAARWLAAGVAGDDRSGLYGGLTGTAYVLRAVSDTLGVGGLETAALDLVRQRFDGERWGESFELLFGNAGIALGALALGADDLAVLALEPYLRTAEVTEHGVQWQGLTGAGHRMHHISHGTLGIALALVTVGDATGRADLEDLGRSALADVVSRDEAGPDGFLVPHSDPPHPHPWNPRYSYGWCHGPAGDAQVFRAMARLDPAGGWTGLADRCWHTVTTSGLPARREPGFWDNSGRCCGTAGVLALALDRWADGSADRAFTDVLVADLADRAITTDDGACWRHHDFRTGDLPPEPGWAMGNAGIVRELLRYDRLASGGEPAYAVSLPDQLR